MAETSNRIYPQRQGGRGYIIQTDQKIPTANMEEQLIKILLDLDYGTQTNTLK